MTPIRRRAVLVLAASLGALGAIAVQRAADTVLAQARTQPPGRNQPSPAAAAKDGRFEIVFSPRGVRQDTFLLDTQTGKIWRPTELADLEGAPTVWHYEERVDNRQELLTWAAGFNKKKAKQ